MPRKVIIDVDAGIDDAVALAMALFDPRLEVLGVTATAGNVPAEQATGNLQAIVSLLDPPRLPRIGVAPADVTRPDRTASVHGPDGLGGADIPRVQLHGGNVSEKVIHEIVKANPREVTILALGPLTNLSRVLRRDPSIVESIGEVVVSGGTWHGHGSITPVADFNFFADPLAARHVVREPLTKTLVPLETTGQVVFDFGLLEEIPDESSRVGFLLHRTLPPLYRGYRQLLGIEGVRLHDAVAVVSLLHPELFERATVAADVETSGELTAGMLVIDRRQIREWRPNVDILTACDAAAVRDCILRGLTAAARDCG